MCYLNELFSTTNARVCVVEAKYSEHMPPRKWAVLSEKEPVPARGNVTTRENSSAEQRDSPAPRRGRLSRNGKLAGGREASSRPIDLSKGSGVTKRGRRKRKTNGKT